MPPGKKVIKTPAGRLVEVDETDIEQAGGAVGREATESEVIGDLERQGAEETFGGIPGKIAAGAHGLASGLTLGGSDLLLRSAGGGDVLRGVAEANPMTRLAGEAVGSIVGPGGAVGKAVGKAAGPAVGAFAEGAVQGIGSGVAQTALAEDDITIERLLGNVSSNAMLGGGIGALAHGVGKGVEAVLGKARKGAAAVEARAGKAAAGDPVAMKAKTADDILEYHATAREDGRWLIADADPKAKAVLTKADRSMRGIADTPDTFRASPGQAAKALEREELALTKIRNTREAGLEQLAKEDVAIGREVRLDLDTMPSGAAETTLTGKAAQRYGAFADVKVSSKNPVVKVTREEAEGFANAIEAGEVQGARAAAYESLDASIEKVATLRKALAEATAPAKAVKESLLEKMVSGSLYGATVGAIPAIPFGAVVAPAIGAKVSSALTDLLFKRAGGAVGSAAAGTAKALDVLLGAAEQVNKVAVPLSSKILTSVRFDEEEKRGPGRPKKDEVATASKSGRDGLVNAFRAREKELRGQVATGPDGIARMTPAARTKVGEHLAPIKQVQPMLADKLETAAARRVEFLASKLPKRPDYLAMQFGPDSWRPSELEMRRFARYVAAAEDPAGVEERLAHGRLSPEDAEAYRAVYPERFEALKMDIIQRASQLKKQLPYEKRLALSMFTGVPLVPALRPEILRVLQSQYTDEPGTQGGTVAPTAQPAFGSVSKEQPTPAQSRAGG